MAHGDMVPYSHINADTDVFAGKGGFKPIWAAGLKKMSPKAMREVWELYTDFVGKDEGLKQSFCMVECYCWDKVREVGDEETAFPWRREVDFWA
jgi:hypothetical protein